MKAEDEVFEHICKLVPAADHGIAKAVLAAIGDAQIFFAAGDGVKVVDGKSVYPDYVQIQIKSSFEAARLAQQLMSACADALGSGGELRTPVTLFLAGQAEISV
jgi:hypothetical protein